MIHIVDKRHVSRICKELHTTVKILNKKNFQTWYQTDTSEKNEMLNKHYLSEKCSLNGIQEYITNSSTEWLNLKKKLAVPNCGKDMEQVEFLHYW